MRRLIQIFSFIILSQLGFSQTSLTGVITDGNSNEVIIGATVAIYDKGIFLSGAIADFDGVYTFLDIEAGTYTVKASYIGYSPNQINAVIILKDTINVMDISLSCGTLLDEVVIVNYRTPLIETDYSTVGATVTSANIKSLPVINLSQIAANSAGISKSDNDDVSIRGSRSDATEYYLDGIRMRGNLPPSESTGVVKIIEPIPQEINNETYESKPENYFRLTTDEALSTFSIDVDRASYSNVRRLLNHGNLPTPDAVRIEEMVNYFDYNYDGPKGDKPFAIHHEITTAPWNKKYKVLKVALQGERVDIKSLPPSNFVFLLDVSGSMQSANKLGLVKASIKLMLDNLKKDDKVAIVVYAGSAGLVLESTPISEREKILTAIEKLRAGGSTAGGAGIKLAYKVAKDNFIQDGNNRVILATDGDFNVGVNNPNDLEKLIEKEREGGVFLSVLGYGMGNYRDDMMQRLADKGNGNHNYIDNIQEAKKVLITEFAGTMYTLAKDVKIQIEFNPQNVQAYRLIGYTNRMLNKEDFNDDKKDAGELGRGHTVTALYEIIPVGADKKVKKAVDPLKYQVSIKSKYDNELCTVKLRYKEPDEDKSKKIELVIDKKELNNKKVSKSTKFAMAVAGFGMILTKSEYINDWSYKDVVKLAKKSKKHDPDGYKAEFVRLVEICESLDTRISID